MRGPVAICPEGRHVAWTACPSLPRPTLNAEHRVVQEVICLFVRTLRPFPIAGLSA
jgi:hypothetical protein